MLVTNDFYFSIDTGRQSQGGERRLIEVVVVVMMMMIMMMVKALVVVVMVVMRVILCWSPATSTSPWAAPDSLMMVSVI